MISLNSLKVNAGFPESATAEASLERSLEALDILAWSWDMVAEGGGAPWRRDTQISFKELVPLMKMCFLCSDLLKLAWIPH